MVVLTEFGSIHLLDFVGPQFIEEKGLVYMEEGGCDSLTFLAPGTILNSA